MSARGRRAPRAGFFDARAALAARGDARGLVALRGGWLWCVRLGVPLLLALVLMTHGPQAWAVLAARLPQPQASRAEAGPRVALDRVGFGARPKWLEGPLLLAVLADLQPRLAGTVGLLDDAAVQGARRRLLESPWIAGARFERRFPDRLGLVLDVRRPVLEVHHESRGQPQVLVDANGVVLPLVDAPAATLQDGPAGPGAPPLAVAERLPCTVLHGVPAGGGMPARPGFPHPDPRVHAAVAVALEWQREVAPLVPHAPALVEVDASNLDYAFLAARRFAEVRVGLRRQDGGVAWFDYDHPPGHPAPRVPAAVKADVLGKVLAAHPGLHGLHGGDLRFANRWRDWLVTAPRDG